MAELLSVATALPPHQFGPEAVQEFLTAAFPRGLASRFGALAETTRVERRHAVMPWQELLELRTLESRNQAYALHAVGLGAAAAEAALGRTPLGAGPIDAVVAVSCTGHMLPSLDAHLIGRLGLSPEARRLPINALGCSGGAAGLAVASTLADQMRARVLLVCVEVCSLCLQHAEPTPADVLGSLLFTDGAAAAIVSPGSTGCGLEVLASGSTLFAEARSHLGMELRSSGYRFVLSSALPRFLERNLGAAVDGFLARNRIARSDLTFFVLHPGGPKILDAVAAALEIPDHRLEACWEAWRRFGNVSSATVLFVLEHLRDTTPPARGEIGLMLAVGPGLSCEMSLLRW